MVPVQKKLQQNFSHCEFAKTVVLNNILKVPKKSQWWNMAKFRVENLLHLPHGNHVVKNEKKNIIYVVFVNF